MVIQTAKVPSKGSVKQAGKPALPLKAGDTITFGPKGVTVTKAPKPAPKKRGRQPSGQVIVTLRMDPEVRDKLQADGAGWGARANAILRKALGL